MSSLLGRDVLICVITTLQTKNRRDKKNPQRKYDDIEALSAKIVQCGQEATPPHLGFTVEEKPTLQYSYEVAYRIAECKKRGRKRKSSKFCSLLTPFADGLTTWLLMCTGKFAPTSSKSRSRLAFNWKSLPKRLESHLIAFARYEKNRKMKEEFLFSNTPLATTTAANVKALVDSFLKSTSSAGRISSTSVLTVPQR